MKYINYILKHVVHVIILVFVLTTLTTNSTIATAKNNSLLTTRTRTNTPPLFISIVKNMNKCRINTQDICSFTTYWIRDAFGNNETILPVKGKKADILSSIQSQLTNGKIVYIRLETAAFGGSCDHHFIITKDDRIDQIYIFQSFADAFTLANWIDYYYRDNNQHVLSVVGFMHELDEFLFKQDANDFDAMKKLFTVNTKDSFMVAKKCFGANSYRKFVEIKTYDYKSKGFFGKLPKNDKKGDYQRKYQQSLIVNTI